MENKQAYLIIAHKADLAFKALLRMLDDPRNDIFIHMDKKNTQYNEEETISWVKKKCSISRGTYQCHMGSKSSKC